MNNAKRTRMIVATIIVAILSIFIVLTVSACKPPVEDKQVEKLNIKPLADLTDYGAQNSAYNVAKATYNSTVESDKRGDLVKKQTEERKAAYERMFESLQAGYEQETIDNWEADSWNNNKYHHFALPYLNTNDEWERDNYDTTITKVFCYADMEKVMERLKEAGVLEPEMKLLVEYISREDSAERAEKEKYSRYNFIEGTDSAIRDFNDLDEIDALLKDWNSKSDTDGLIDGKKEDDWKDLQSLKRRKVNGEIYKIFGDKADMFARFSIHITAYQYEVLEQVIMPLYAKMLELNHKEANEGYTITTDSWKTFYQERAEANVINLPNYSELGEFSAVNSKVTNSFYEKPFVYFMKNSMIDFEQLVYLIAYNVEVNLNETYRPTVFPKMMTLQGYNYQYQKKDYGVWKDLNEYREYLTLSRKEYLSSKEAVRYRDLDSRHYKNAYRYHDKFYNKYYESQLSFQLLQEAIDLPVFSYKMPEDIEASEFYGSYEKGIPTNGILNQAKSYVRQLQKGLNEHSGTTHSLLIADGNNLYMSNNTRLNNYNNANTAYYSLSEEKRDLEANKIHKVILHCKQLGIQSFLLDLPELSKSNYTTFKEFLAFQQYSYYSDWIRAGQSYRKDIVLKQEEYFRQRQRLTEVGLDSSEALHKEQLKIIKDELGRKDAFLKQVNNNINAKSPSPQHSKEVKFDTIKNEIDQVRKEDDYRKYSPKTGEKRDIERFFVDRLIKKEWPEGQKWGALGEGYDEEGRYVEKEYSKTWQISRMMLNHDYIFRHSGGQIRLDLQKIEGAEATVHSYFENYREAMEQDEVNDVETSEILEVLLTKGKPVFLDKVTRSNSDDITLERGKEIVSELLAKDSKGKWDKKTSRWTNAEWIEQPKYHEKDAPSAAGHKPMLHTWTKDKHKYTIEFVAWCLDDKCNFEVSPDEKFGFNMKLYPKYNLTVQIVS